MAMRLWEFMTAITAIGCSTGVIITTVDKIFGTRRQSREEELRRVKEQSGLQAQQIAELRRQNEQLQKQLEWHAKLLETQDNLMKQLTSGTPSGTTGSEAARADTSSPVR
jgi:hypothetical protein